MIVETHDRLTPTPKPGIIKRHEFTVILKPNKQIDESWEQADITRNAHPDPGGERSTAMGENTGKSVWRVQAAIDCKELLRITSSLLFGTLKFQTARHAAFRSSIYSSRA